jgi:alpha-D-ribose 1-methylphosphonate 5-triphosphate synthase subunit PhnG
MTATFSRTDALSILTHTHSEAVTTLAEYALEQLGDVQVLKNQTGLVMLPYTDSSHGTRFHLGEVLVAEAHIQLSDGTQGYGMVLGRDLLFAMGVAVLDAAYASGVLTAEIERFLHEQQQAQAAADDELLRKVEATRVEMETF